MIISIASIGLIKLPKNGYHVSCPWLWLGLAKKGSSGYWDLKIFVSKTSDTAGQKSSSEASTGPIKLNKNYVWASVRVIELWAGLVRCVGAVFMNSVVRIVDYGGAYAMVWFLWQAIWYYQTDNMLLLCR